MKIRLLFLSFWMVWAIGGQAQKFFYAPLYSFTGRVIIGSSNTPDSSAYLTIGPLTGATRGLRLSRIADTATIVGTKRMGLMAYLAQKSAPSWYDSAAGYWKAFGGETNTMSSAGGTSIYKSKTGVNFDMKGITAGTGITVTAGTNDVVISATGTGSFSPTVRVVNNADFTVGGDDYTIILKNNSTGKNATLPPAVSYTNRMLVICNTGTGSITSSETLRTDASTTTTTIGSAHTICVQSDGTEWWIVYYITR